MEGQTRDPAVRALCEIGKAVLEVDLSVRRGESDRAWMSGISNVRGWCCPEVRRFVPLPRSNQYDDSMRF